MPNKVSDALIYLTADGEVAKTPNEVAFTRQIIHFDDGSFTSKTSFVVDKVEKSLQIILDGVDNEKEFEKKLLVPLISRILQVFKGKKGLWFTRSGKRIFINANNLPPILKPEGVSVKLSGISTRGANKLLRKLKTNISDITDGFSFDHKGFKTNNLKITINKFGPSSEPSQIVITGNIVNFEGLIVGNFLRSILPNAKQAMHASIRLDKKFQGNGISNVFMQNKFKLYRNIRLKEVNLVTDKIGKYAWAVQGFDFQTIGTALIFQKKFTKFLIKQTGRKDIPWEKVVGDFKHPWDFARFRWNRRKLGKEFLINNAPGWRGVFDLDLNSNSSKIFNEFSTKIKTGVNVKQLKFTDLVIRDDILEKISNLKEGFGDQNSKAVNIEVFDNEDAILDGLDKLFGSLNFNEKSIKEFVVADEDDFAFPLPEDIESQFPIIPDGVEVIELPEELEKKLFGLLSAVGKFAGRVLQTFKGQKGFWVTSKGKRLFIKAKVVHEALPKDEIDLVVEAFSKLPKIMQNEIKLLRISKTPVFGRPGRRNLGAFTIFPEARMTIWSRVIKSVKGKILDDVLVHEGAHAVYAKHGFSPTSKLFNTFRRVSLKEGGVTVYSDSYAHTIRPGPLGTPNLTSPRGFAEFNLFANENFSEMWMLYLARSRNAAAKGRWVQVEKNSSGTVKAFLNILESLNAK